MTARPELQNVRLQVPRLVLALLNAYGNVDRDTLDTSPCLIGSADPTGVTGLPAGTVIVGTDSTLRQVDTDGSTLKLFRTNAAGGTQPDLIFATIATLTIASGIVTATQGQHALAGEGGNADTLSSILGLTAGELVLLRAVDAADAITIEHGVGANLIACPHAKDIVLTQLYDWALGVYNGTQTTIIAFSTVAANAGGAGAIIGLLSALTTTDKASVVAAVNEVQPKAAVVTRETTTVGAKVVLPEGTNNGVHTLTLQGPASLAASRTITFPDTDVSLGDIAANTLKTAMLTRETTVAGGKIVLAEGTDNGVNTLTLAAPAVLGGNRTITPPDADVALANVMGTIADPGNGLAIPVTISGVCNLTTGGGGETRTLAIPTAIGQRIGLHLNVDGGGDCVVTVASAFNQDGDTVITLNDAGDYVELVGVHIAGALRWREASDVERVDAALGVLDGQVAALGAENADGQIHIPLLAGLADGGTWAKAVTSGGLVSVARTAADAPDSYWVEIPAPSRTTASRGIKPTGLRVNYSVATADVADVRFELWKVTQGADNAARTAAVLFGEDNADYDADHNTAAERSDDTAAPELHLAIVTDAGTPAYVAAGETLMLRCYVDGDAGAAGVVTVTSAVLLVAETLVDLS